MYQKPKYIFHLSVKLGEIYKFIKTMNKKEEVLYKNLRIYLENNINYLNHLKTLVITLEKLEQFKSENEKIEQEVLSFEDIVRELKFKDYGKHIIETGEKINKKLQTIIK